MKRLELRGTWVLVTGASGGLGRQLALQLAKERGANVVAVARRAPLLQSLADEIHATTQQRCVPVTADVGTTHGAAACFEQATHGRQLAAAVLNAGVTWVGPATEHPDADFERMLGTNVVGLVALARRFLGHAQTHGQPAGLLLVSSLASVAPMPFQASYAGTKAFVTQYGRTLNHELSGQPARVTVFLPGGIATEMLDLAGMGTFKKGDFGIMPADVCARSALGALVRRKAHHAPGLLYGLGQLVLKLVPFSVAGAVSERIFSKGRTFVAPAPRLPAGER